MDLTIPFNELRCQYEQNPNPSLDERLRILKTIKQGLQNNPYDLAAAINKDFTHRSQQETLLLEVMPLINALDYCLSNIKGWMKKRARHVPWTFFPAKAYLVAQPLGIVGNIVPWNYPLYLALAPVIYALCAGNRIMIKMSELAPHTGEALAQFVTSLGLGHAIIVVNGDVAVSKQFAALPFNHLIFTGSTAVGKLVMAAASEHLTPIILELGGKSPAVLSLTMKRSYYTRLFMGKLFNAGQTCIAPDYLLIPPSMKNTVINELAYFIDSHYPSLMNNPHYSSMISATHKSRMLALIADAKAKGAKIIEHGILTADSNRVPVYLVLDVNLDMRLMQEEIFGPILPVVCYDAFSDALSFINKLPNPLALYYFGEDRAERAEIELGTLSGALTINDTLMHIAIDDLPFGGVGASGMGQYHGKEGFNSFSKLKPVFKQSRFSAISWLYPPYGCLFQLAVKWLGGIKRKQ